MLIENFLSSKEYCHVVESGIIKLVSDIVKTEAHKTKLEGSKLKDLKVCFEDGACTVKDGLSQNEGIDVENEMGQTPPTEKVVKRSAANIVCHENDDEHGSQTSTNKKC